MTAGTWQDRPEFSRLHFRSLNNPSGSWYVKVEGYVLGGFRSKEALECWIEMHGKDGLRRLVRESQDRARDDVVAAATNWFRTKVAVPV